MKVRSHTFDFKDRFVSVVESGRKRCTIRKIRRRLMPVVGETAVFYNGRRRRDRKAYRIGAAPILSITLLRIGDGRIEQLADEDFFGCGRTWREMPAAAAAKLARDDGFADIGELHDFLGTGAGSGRGEYFLTRWGKIKQAKQGA